MSAVPESGAGRLVSRPWPSRWRSALMASAAGLILLLLVYWPTFAAMAGIWYRSDTFAHGFLIAPISAWLVWRERERIKTLVPAPQWAALWVVALACALWLVAELTSVAAASQFAVVLALVGVLAACLGPKVTKALAFPLAFLFFMVPVGDFLMPLLMDRTADVTVAGLKLLGIPVYRDGLQFIIPSGAWSVVEACSGVRYLIASFMVGTLFAYLNYQSLSRRLVFVAVSLIVPIFANWARAIMIVLLGHFSGNTLAVGVDHLVYGWVFFGIVIMIMFAVGARWSEPEAPLAAPVQAATGPSSASSMRLWAPVLVLATAVLLAPRLASNRLAHESAMAPELSKPGPALALAEAQAPVDYRPYFQRPSDVFERSYQVGSQRLSLHVAYYRNQSYGSKLVASTNMLVRSDDHQWHRTSSGQTSVAVQGQALALRTAGIRAGAVAGANERVTRLKVRQVLWVDGQFVARDSHAVLLSLWSQLKGRGNDAAALTWFVPETQEQGADKALDEFASTQLPALNQWLEQVRAKR